ncbi:MAG: hypothetical protein ACR2QM_12615 [Longimicrobiales bacterium]
MNRDDIMQVLYETQDFIPTKDRRRRAVDFAIAARRAERKRDPYAAEKNYMRAAAELRSSSSDRSHAAALLMDKEAHRLRNGGLDA